MVTQIEAYELVKAWLATSLAFGILLWFDNNDFLFSFLVALFTVGLGFLLHELCHRAVARHYRKHAEFRANDQMLVLSILMSFLGIVIAAPGAVMISGFVSRRENGVIAAAGPAANLVLAALFIPLMLVYPRVAYYGFMINALMGLFNLIPAPGFDGQKVIEWSKPAYFTLAAIAIILNLLNVILPNIT
jgi:Zn-dependent protease